MLRRNAKARPKGTFVLPEADRLFNPSRGTARLLAKVDRTGPASARLAGEIFARLGRPGQRAIYGLAQLPRHYARADIEAASTTVLGLAVPSYQALKRLLERRAAETPETPAPTLAQAGEAIRQIDEYHTFWEHHAQSTNPGPSTPHH